MPYADRKHVPMFFRGCNIYNVSSVLEGDKGSDCWFSINRCHTIILDWTLAKLNGISHTSDIYNVHSSNKISLSKYVSVHCVHTASYAEHNYLAMAKSQRNNVAAVVATATITKRIYIHTHTDISIKSNNQFKNYANAFYFMKLPDFGYFESVYCCTIYRDIECMCICVYRSFIWTILLGKRWIYDVLTRTHTHTHICI